MSEKKPSRIGRIVKGLIVAILLLVIVGIVLYFIYDEPVPKGEPGIAADQMAQKMMAAVDHNAWLWTGAVSWNFAGRNDHLWDRRRNYARVRWDDVEVLIALGKKSGLVYKNGEKVAPDQSGPYLEKAWAFWANDSFWLNPVSKVMDFGVERALVDLGDEGKGLLVTYTQGGVTPGDSYLWVLGEDGLPVYWKMWVSILPLGGIKITWEDWQTLSTGVKVSTKHQTPAGDLLLTNIKAAKSIQALVPDRDPFAPLAAIFKKERSPLPTSELNENAPAESNEP